MSRFLLLGLLTAHLGWVGSGKSIHILKIQIWLSITSLLFAARKRNFLLKCFNNTFVTTHAYFIPKEIHTTQVEAMCLELGKLT